MSDLREAIEGGHYASKQIFSRDKLVAWSHARRFDTAIALAREFAGKRVLDYGCGDGTFLALALMSPDAPGSAVGADPSARQLEDCRQRYRSERRLQFVSMKDLDGDRHAGRYDAVFCMEVLEHVVDWEPELTRFARLLAPPPGPVRAPASRRRPLPERAAAAAARRCRSAPPAPGRPARSVGRAAGATRRPRNRCAARRAARGSPRAAAAASRSRSRRPQ